MNVFSAFVHNKYIYVPFLVWLSIQIYKFIHDLIKTKKFDFKRLIGMGGMPSSHSAVVMSLATLIGKYEGVNTPIFALALIMAIVVMYDACGVRRAAGEQSMILNKMLEKPELKEYQNSKKLDENLGHTPVQVFVGGLIGFFVGILA